MENEIPEIIGSSQEIKRIREAVKKTAPTKSRVFITGEEGVGKSFIAEIIHNHSGRKNFAVNGDFNKIKQGTLFFSEIMEISFEEQKDLLAFIKENNNDVKIIAATRMDVEKQINSGKFSPDLYHRLSVVPIHIPPLRERKEDIPLLCDHFMSRICKPLNYSKVDISKNAMTVLQSCEWERNVAQLKNVVEWLVMFNDCETIEIDDLPMHLISVNANNPLGLDVDIMTMPLKTARQLFEKNYLKTQINRFSGNISKTAEFVGMERSALHRKLKNLNVDTKV